MFHQANSCDLLVISRVTAIPKPRFQLGEDELLKELSAVRTAILPETY
jgi:hypothetical protein